MNLVEILTEYQSTIAPEGLEVIGSIDGLEATGLSFDSREVQTGNIFFCISGGTHDGHEYVIQAIEHGAVAVVAAASWTEILIRLRILLVNFLKIYL